MTGPTRLLAAHRQSGHRVRLEWGPTGALAVAGPGVAAEVDAGVVAVVVDVLSFTTTLTVALDRGITVLPHPWRDERAAAYAVQRDATLAVGRLEARSGAGGVSLSPAAMTRVDGVRRLVLPSPNGSTICAALARTGAVVVGASLLNAAAVAGMLATHLAKGGHVAVVPAGERWTDGSLRPAVEDLWGAGAVLAALRRLVPDAGLSPEARVAERAHAAVADRLPEELRACASGRELVDVGFGDDVDTAARVDTSTQVPVLRDGEFAPQT